jgi:SAM-dependent methyltransferase
LACAACAADYPSRGGIVDFRVGRYDYYFNPVPREEMSKLIEQASTVPWDATVRHFLKHVKDLPGWLDNIAVNARYAWKLLLELPAGARFLDFGCGLGNMTQNIAPHVAEVVALDLTWERLQFARERFAKFNAGERITLVAGGDGRHLPFPDNHFDCIALSGVLEWMAADYDMDESDSRPAKAVKMLMSFFGSTNPRKEQLRFMQELRRILKPGGQLFVAIENRWAYEYFNGFPDHHSGLSYNSLLPRFIANIYSIVRARQPYRTYTYSFNEFRRLFASAGFPRQEFYGLSPGYSFVAEIIPAMTDQPFWSAPRAPTLKERIKRSRYFVPAFGVVARATAARPVSLLGRLLEEIKRDLGASGEFRLTECLITNKEKIVLKGSIGGAGIVLKIPADQRAAAGEDNSRRILEALARDPEIAKFTPAPLARGAYQGLSYFMERAVAGRPLTSLMAEIPRASAAVKVKSLFLKMHSKRRVPTAIAPGSAEFDLFVSRPIRQLRVLGFEPDQCDGLERHFRAGIVEHPWVIGLYHGDFTSDNILVAGGEISGVIDWEYATERGLPPLDAIAYVECMQRVADPRATATNNLTRLANWDWPSNEELDLLKAVYAHFHVDPELHGFLCRLSWMQHIASLLDTGVRFDPGFMELVRPALAEVASA